MGFGSLLPIARTSDAHQPAPSWSRRFRHCKVSASLEGAMLVSFILDAASFAIASPDSVDAREGSLAMNALAALPLLVHPPAVVLGLLVAVSVDQSVAGPSLDYRISCCPTSNSARLAFSQRHLLLMASAIKQCRRMQSPCRSQWSFWAKPADDERRGTK